MQRGAVIGLVTAALIVSHAPAASAARAQHPNFLHGVAVTLRGLVMELPVTVLEATLSHPPVVGTIVGLLGGVVRAVRTTASGLEEMFRGFDPWGSANSE